MYLVDTNIFLEVLKSQEGGMRAVPKIATGWRKTSVIIDFTVHSIILIMDELNGLTLTENVPIKPHSLRRTTRISHHYNG
jgi:hypothetical protein